MSNPVIYAIIQICLGLEATGVCAASWVLGSALRTVTGCKTDESYLTEENADEDHL